MTALYRSSAKPGRPAASASAKDRRRVEELRACGMTVEEIAGAFELSPPTLRRLFAAELRTGAAKRRAEVIALLFRSARAGNVAAQKKLEDMTSSVAAAERRPLSKPAPLGKKARANAEALTAEDDTSWAAILRN